MRVQPISEDEVERLARRFHSIYESWAPSFGWDTQEVSQVAWDDLPSNQRSLMLTVVREVVAPMARQRDVLRTALIEVRPGLENAWWPIVDEAVSQSF